MDHNYFSLALDTTGSEIDVYMPTYATPNVDNEIIVQGSELLAPWQDFYFIDAADARHDFIFAYEGDHFVGLVRFNQFAIGVATLYAQAKDEVYNPSPLLTKSLNIISGGAYMSVCSMLHKRELVTDTYNRHINVCLAQQAIKTQLFYRSIEVSIDVL